MNFLRVNFFQITLSLVIVTLVSYVFYKNYENTYIVRDYSSYLPTMEATPIVYNGKLLLVTFDRKAEDSFGRKVGIYDALTFKKITELNWDKGLGTAVVHKGKILLFGSSDWSKEENCLYTVELKLGGHPVLENERKIYCAAPKHRIFNSSVTKVNSNYVLTYEEDENKSNLFYPTFLKSKSLSNFIKIDVNYRKGAYTACPTIRYSMGFYHLFFLDRTVVDGKTIYKTKMTFAKTLKGLNEGKVVTVLDPIKSGISVNNSDLDFASYKGKTYLFFSESDQKSWSRVYKATFGSSEKDFLRYLRGLRN